MSRTSSSLKQPLLESLVGFGPRLPLPRIEHGVRFSSEDARIFERTVVVPISCRPN